MVGARAPGAERSRGRRLTASALVTWLLLLVPATALARGPKGNTTRGRPVPTHIVPWRGEVFVVGSSSIRSELGAEIESDLRTLGFDVLRHGVSATGLARPDFYDWFATSAWLPVSTRTLAVIFYLGVNDTQGLFEVGRDWLPGLGRPQGKGEAVPWVSARWSAEYLRRLVSFIDSFCRRGARDVFVLLPVDVRNLKFDERLLRIRNLQVEAVRWSQCGRTLDTRGDAEWLAGESERRQPRRRPDGFHMTPYGAHMVWLRVRDQVLDVFDRLEGVPAGKSQRQPPPPPERE